MFMSHAARRLTEVILSDSKTAECYQIFYDLINVTTTWSYQRLLRVKMNLELNEKMFYRLLLAILLFHLKVDGNYFGTNSKKDDQCFCKVLDVFFIFLHHSLYNIILRYTTWFKELLLLYLILYVSTILKIWSFSISVTLIIYFFILLKRAIV